MSPDAFARLKICKKMHLRPGLRPDPVRGAHSAPQTLSWIWGPFCGWDGKVREEKGKGRRRKRRKRKGRGGEGKGREERERDGR